MILYDFYEKGQKNILPGGLTSGPREKYNRRFPRRSKKRKPNNDDKHDHGKKKRKPSTLCWGKKLKGKLQMQLWKEYYISHSKHYNVENVT